MGDFDDLDDEISGVAEPPSEAGRAFDASAYHSFRGEKLQPFSGFRMRLAELLHLKFFLTLQRSQSDDDIKSGFALGTYDGLQHDTAVVLFLCSRPRSGIEWGFEKPGKLLREMNLWADSKNLYRGTAEFEEGSGVAMQILFEILGAMPGDDGPKKAAPEKGAKKKSSSRIGRGTTR